MESIVLWLLAAALLGGLAKRLGLPNLVGYLLAGFMLSGFGLPDSPLLESLGSVGVFLLLFSIGLHLRVKSLLRPEVTGPGSLHFVVTLALFSGGLLLVGLVWLPALLFGFALSFSSTVLTAKSLADRRELDTFHGRVAIGVLILQDVLAVAGLALLGDGAPSLWALGLPLLLLARPLLGRLLAHLQQDELLLVAGLGLAFAIGALFELVGLDSKLGALVAGLLLAEGPSAHRLDEQIWGMKELFLIGFFIDIGLDGLPSARQMGLALVLLGFLPLKGLLFFVSFLLWGLRARTAFLASLTLSAYSEFALIVGIAAVDAGLLPPELLGTLTMATVGSFLLNAPLSRAANALWIRLEPFFVRFERNVRHPDHQLTALGSVDFLVLGMGRVGSAAYDRLVELGRRPVGLDADPAIIAASLEASRRVIFGDAQDPELWSGLPLEQIDGVILTLPSLQAKTRAVRFLRENGYTGPIHALIREEADAAFLAVAGVTATTLPMLEIGRELAELSVGAGSESSTVGEKLVTGVKA